MSIFTKWAYSNVKRLLHLHRRVVGNAVKGSSCNTVSGKSSEEMIGCTSRLCGSSPKSPYAPHEIATHAPYMPKRDGTGFKSAMRMKDNFQKMCYSAPRVLKIGFPALFDRFESPAAAPTSRIPAMIFPFEPPPSGPGTDTRYT